MCLPTYRGASSALQRTRCISISNTILLMLCEEAVAVNCRTYTGHVNRNVVNVWCFNVNPVNAHINHLGLMGLAA
jgi:hypothetical protein